MAATTTEAEAGSDFRERFGRNFERAAQAPGRVNLIGEHTDYNGGFVLPTAIPQKTRAEVARRSDRRVRAASAEADRGRISEFVLGEETRRGAWIDYIQGVTAELARRGLAVPGFDLWIQSAVPLGSGLSSSAALEVSVLRALRDLAGFPLDDVTLALVGQRAENDLVGAPVGIMDQMASSLADVGVALFLDTRSLASERIPIPRGAGLLVVDSGVRHDHASGDYRRRRAECEDAARRLGVRELRDLTVERRPDLERLPEPLRRRARHVVTENERVIEASAALRRSDLPLLGRLFDASHESQRDDFEVSVPAVDAIVAAARAEPGVFGARLTGGGFGGSVVVLAGADGDADRGPRIVERAARAGAPAARLVVVSGEKG
ncbi:MAG: galactokinase [Acidobacteria bacterium]|nr:galactokinase [Acidobacteriota bacterium]MCA1617481.1 galactokinase [Acidobacteriota bacterium]